MVESAGLETESINLFISLFYTIKKCFHSTKDDLTTWTFVTLDIMLDSCRRLRFYPYGWLLEDQAKISNNIKRTIREVLGPEDNVTIMNKTVR